MPTKHFPQWKWLQTEAAVRLLKRNKNSREQRAADIVDILLWITTRGPQAERLKSSHKISGWQVWSDLRLATDTDNHRRDALCAQLIKSIGPQQFNSSPQEAWVMLCAPNLLITTLDQKLIHSVKLRLSTFDDIPNVRMKLKIIEIICQVLTVTKTIKMIPHSEATCH